MPSLARPAAPSGGARLDIQRIEGAPFEVLLVATVDGREAGVLIAERRGELARLMSVVVEANLRRRGVATGLLAALRSHLAGTEVRRVDAMYGGGPDADVVNGLLRKAGFTWPVSSMMVGVGTERILDGRWSRARPLPEDRIEAWTDLAAEAEATLRPAQWFPDALGPFPEAPVEPLSSVGLVVQGAVVGWCLTHRLDVKTVRYSRLYVHPAHRRGRRGVALLAEAIRRQRAAGIPYGRFGVRTDNAGMLRFAERWLVPHLASWQETIHAVLPLAPLTPGSGEAR